jgi:hypothetical protein
VGTGLAVAEPLRQQALRPFGKENKVFHPSRTGIVKKFGAIHPDHQSLSSASRERARRAKQFFYSFSA